MLEPRHRWVPPAAIALDPVAIAAGARHGLSGRVTGLLASRGVTGGDDLDQFFGPAEAGLHDPALLPDAAILLDRITRARAAGERVLVFGDFDADGLTGLAITVRALRRFGVEAIPYVPSRLEEGHGLSMAAVEAAVELGVAVIVTVDCGSTSDREIRAATERGLDVIVTDHHRVPPVRPPAIALVNPHRPDAAYPDRRLSGAGIAFAVARLLLRAADGPSAALDLSDLATIGTVADVAPLVGENRAIARLGIERLRTGPTAGLAALLASARVDVRTADAETIAFALAPRINAAGRVGEASLASRLLLTDDPSEAAGLAAELEAANRTRRDLTREVVDAARVAAAADDGPAVTVRGPWPIGIVGLAAARLSEELNRPAAVGAEVGDTIRASLRGDGSLDLGAALEQLGDLFVRHGGHAGAAGFELDAARWPEFRERFHVLAAAAGPTDPRPRLSIDLAMAARDVDYGLHRDLARLAPTGPGNPDPVVAVLGAVVTRVRAAQGGHTQLVVRRDRDVLDAIAFNRPDLAEQIREGDQVDLAARLSSRVFAGLETLQLDIRDVAPAGHHPWLADLAAGEPTPAGAGAGR